MGWENLTFQEKSNQINPLFLNWRRSPSQKERAYSGQGEERGGLVHAPLPCTRLWVRKKKFSIEPVFKSSLVV